MAGWHHQLNGHKFEQTPADGEGQGSLACCSPWGDEELDTTEPLNNNNLSSEHLLLPFPSPGDLPNPGIEPRSPVMQEDSLPAEPPGKAFCFQSGASVSMCERHTACQPREMFDQNPKQG